MSLFASMLEKLGLRRKEHGPAASTAQPKGAPTPGAAIAPSRAPAQHAAPATAAKSQPQAPRPAAPSTTPAKPAAVNAPAPMTDVDVVAKLEAMAAANPQPLNWRTSIVDLMKLLGMDSGFAERKALAVELGCPPQLMQDSAQMNVWLHKEVLRQIARNGGNVPRDLYD